MNFPSRGAAVCALVAAGATPHEIYATMKVRLMTLTRWLAECPQFRRRYAQARRLYADSLVNEVIGIADALTPADGDDGLRRSRLRIDARKWAAGQSGERQAAPSAQFTAENPSLPDFDFGSPEDQGRPARDDERP